MTSMTRTGVQNVDALAAYRPIGPPITRLARRAVGSSQVGLDGGAGERITRSCHALPNGASGFSPFRRTQTSTWPGAVSWTAAASSANSAAVS
jgi:hypothetical protein